MLSIISRSHLVGLLLLFIPFAPDTGFGQDPGSISGTVSSASAESDLPGVNVYLEDTRLGAVTDGEGRFVIDGIPPGDYTLVARFVGYTTERREVSLNSGQSVELNLALEEEILEYQGIVVTATGERQRKDRVPAAIGTVDREEIEQAKPAHPSEIMNRIAGVWVNQTSGEGHMTAIRQPLTTDPVYLYLENGVPTRSTGFFNHNALYEVNVPMADDIEVIKGPGTALYGSDAIGGVVNVNSRPGPSRPLASLSAEGGSYGYGRVMGSLGTRVDRSSLRLDGNVSRSDGWRDATDYDRQTGTARWDLDLPDGSSRLTTMATFSNIDQMPAGSSAISEEDFNTDPTINYTPISYRKVKAFRLTSAYERSTPSSGLNVTPFFRFNTQDLLPNWALTFDPAVWESQNYSVGALARYRHDFEPLQAHVVTGIDLDLSPGERIEYRIDPVREDGIFVDYTVEEAIYDYDVTFRQASPYVHGEISPSRWMRLTGGIRLDLLGYDYINHLSVVTEGRHKRAASTDVSYSHLSPKLGATYQLTTNLNAFASYRHAFRVPSESQLFRQGPTNNTLELEPIKADQFELGLRGRFGPVVDYDVSGYWMIKSDDIVSFVDETGTTVSTNAGETLHRGVEVGLGVAPLAGLHIRGSFSYANHTYEEWQPNASTDLSGNQMDVAPHDIGSLVVTYSPEFLPGSSITAEWMHLGSYWMDPANTVEYDGHELINLRATVYVAGGVSIFARATNLTDELYAERATFNPFRGEEFAPGSPASYFAGIQYKTGG